MKVDLIFRTGSVVRSVKMSEDVAESLMEKIRVGHEGDDFCEADGLFFRFRDILAVRVYEEVDEEKLKSQQNRQAQEELRDSEYHIGTMRFYEDVRLIRMAIEAIQRKG